MARSSEKSSASSGTQGERRNKLLDYLLKRRRRLLKEADEVSNDVEDAERDIRRGARRTDHRFRL